MTPRRTLIGAISALPLLRNAWLGRLLVAILLAILLFFSFFPERHRAAVTLTPTDPASLGLSATLSQLGAINSVFGNQAAVEIALKVARGVYVRETVARELNLMERLKFKNRIEMHRWLNKEVNTRTLRGGIVQIESTSGDAGLARSLVAAYADATQERLAEIQRRQTAYKRDVLVKLVTDASTRLAEARGAYDTFRLQNRFANPVASIEAIASQVPALESAIRAKQVQLSAARQFGTDENIQVRQILAELQGLQAQLAQARGTDASVSTSVGRAVRTSSQGEKLLRELNIAQSLYDNYMRFLEGTSVEDLTSTASVRVLEPPFVDTERQMNMVPLALFLALLLTWGAVEFYRLRPAVGDRVVVRETHAAA